MAEQFGARDAHEHTDTTTTAKLCPHCGGVVHSGITRRQREDGTFVSYAEGVCQSCRHHFDETSS
jgi:hypothetical protein